jgi:hypothetical protein
MTQKGLDLPLSSTKQEMRRNSFLEKYKRKLAPSRSPCYSLPVSNTTHIDFLIALDIDIEKEMQRIDAMSDEEFMSEFMSYQEEEEEEEA